MGSFVNGITALVGGIIASVAAWYFSGVYAEHIERYVQKRIKQHMQELEEYKRSMEAEEKELEKFRNK